MARYAIAILLLLAPVVLAQQADVSLVKTLTNTWPYAPGQPIN